MESNEDEHGNPIILMSKSPHFISSLKNRLEKGNGDTNSHADYLKNGLPNKSLYVPSSSSNVELL